MHIEDLALPGTPANSSTQVASLHHHHGLVCVYYYYPHFTGDGTEAQEFMGCIPAGSKELAPRVTGSHEWQLDPREGVKPARREGAKISWLVAKPLPHPHLRDREEEAPRRTQRSGGGCAEMVLGPGAKRRKTFNKGPRGPGRRSRTSCPLGPSPIGYFSSSVT